MSWTEHAKRQYEARVRQSRSGERAFRERAWAEFERMGLPAKNNEAWKYSSLAPVTKNEWTEAKEASDIPSVATRFIREWRAEFDIAVMLNGTLHKRSSQLSLESGYEFLSVSAEGSQPELAYDDGFVPLAAAVHRGGYYLRVAPGIRFPKPLLIIHCCEGEGAWSSTVNRISIGRDAEFQLAEVYLGGAASYLRTDITKVELEDSAIFNWTRLQSESSQAAHFSEVQTALARASRLSLTQVNSGGSWARNVIKTDVLGPRAEAHIQGLTFGCGTQHIDQRVRVNHRAADTASSQLFKSVLKDEARGVLNGKILIAQDAQRVNSNQLNHALLLSAKAEADTKPELEIYADDVKANHGATVGKMDEEKLFYLMSRAIPRRDAVRMLAHAFVADVLMKVPAVALRGMLAAEVENLLPDFLDQMETVK